jgi:16S rRNA G966 N2-methylase RsmD
MIIEALQPLAVPMKSIKLDPRNARTHNDRNLATIKKSLETYGQRKPIVVNADGVIEAGNGLYLAAKSLGWTEIAAVYVNDDEDYAKGYGVMDNQSALLADWDLPTLKDLLQELDTGAFDMDATGFDAHELEQMMTASHQGNTDDDAVPDDAPPICQPCDLWLLGDHRLLCGDSTKAEDVARLMDGQKADMVFTDPPFDMANTSYMPLLLQYATGAVLVMHSDANIMRLAHEYADQFHYCLVHYYSFGFVRSDSMPQLAHHLIGVFGKPSFRSCKDGFKTVICEQLERDKLMAYQKRVAIPEQCTTHFSDGAVLDAFLGSGSTLIACEKLGRKCYGMELDPHYCDVIIKRWEDYTGRKAEKQQP